MIAPQALLVERTRKRTNCWTCSLSGPRKNHCDALTLDEDLDTPVINWLVTAPLADDGTVPQRATGCPGWIPQ